MKNTIKIILYSLLACGLLYYIEQGVGFTYALKAVLKIGVFLIVPILMIGRWSTMSTSKILGFNHASLKSLKLGGILGSGSFLIIMLLGTLLAPMIDFESLRIELSDKLHVTKNVFLFIGLYITFINSLLEEFFFRGFVYLLIAQEHKKIGMFFSALLFGVYHIAMFQTWFPPMLVIFCVVGLTVVGLFFNWINDQYKSFVNSWLIHIMADSAIMIFAYKMLYM